MSRINRIVLYRLLAAWVVISLLIGVAVSWLGVRKMCQQYPGKIRVICLDDAGSAAVRRKALSA